jgi:outer membrane protein assembly factor BamB
MGRQRRRIGKAGSACDFRYWFRVRRDRSGVSFEGRRMWRTLVSVAACILLACDLVPADEPSVATWLQWRGPTRDGQVTGAAWPASLGEANLKQVWRIELPPSYSGPIATETAVITTATVDKQVERAIAYDRQTGQELWTAEWPGAMSVPFFAAANGSWIRATPACDGKLVVVAGMRDVLVAIDVSTGKQFWKKDFVDEFSSPLPTFGFVSSPLIDGSDLYVQAGASLVKLNKQDGQVAWRALKDDGGMMGSAFSSPTLATLAGKRQLLVQTRAKLVGVDPDNGAVFWEQAVPNFRGMNILTPLAYRDAVFTSSYSNKSWLYQVSTTGGAFGVSEQWSNNAQGYMSTPVLIDDHVYLHLQNQRFTCINLQTGERTWTSQPYGKYASLVAQKDRILALDQSGKLLLIKADPREFTLLEERTISESETWAHLAVCGDELFVRELNALTKFQWRTSQK